MSEIKIYMAPDYPEKSTETGGIRRVCSAMTKHLPSFGIEVVHNPSESEIIVNHGAMLVQRPGIPLINVNHGLYWSRQPWGDNFQEVNQQVIDSMCASVAHTVPSEWVGAAVRRGGFFYPEVVYHGVDPDEFSPSSENGDYVVWDKARADFVSDPMDMQKAAALLPHRQFMTTIGKPMTNVQVLGSLPYSRMAKLVSEAGVFLSTARETFGIGTLEALACGVPVAGWDCGGNSEIIIQGITGYLAPWGDFKALAECIEACYGDRQRLSQNCVEDARTRWRWEPRIEQYANIIKRVHKTYCQREGKPKVSVIVTAYKLDEYLPDCLNSIRGQSYADFECLVVDDAQLDSTRMIVEEFSKDDKRIQYVPTPHNLKLPGARNYGFSKAQGLFIRHMDADDMLAEQAIGMEVAALEADNGLHIAYGHLEVVNQDGSRRFARDGQPERGGWPGPEFNWYAQMAHLNQLPSTVMARREVYERSGGYRERMKRAEDAEFWCRVTSLGFRARKFTQAVTMYHRERADSKGATEWKVSGKEGDWTAWFPWRMGADDYTLGNRIFKEMGNCHPLPHLVPFAAQSKPGSRRTWYVHDYSYPVVSIIVTCGPGHKSYLVDALDSIQAQTYPDWECIVVNDTGEAWDKDFAGAPYARIVNLEGNQGTSKARNAGLQYTRGKYIVWLDADDYWLPWFLEKMVAQIEQNPGVIYSDLIKHEIVEGREKFSVYRYPEFDCSRVNLHMVYPGTSVLYTRQIIQAVYDLQGAYDTQIPGMEDWDFQTAIHSLGFCAYHVEEPLFVYRMYSTSKREKDYNKIDEIKNYLDQKWSDYRKGVKAMGCGCGAKKKITVAQSTLTSSGNFKVSPARREPGALVGQMVEVEYLGEMIAAFGIRSRVDGNVTYRFANDAYHKIRTVFLEDAERLISMTGPDGEPLYRVVAGGTEVPQNNPVTFLGAVIE